MLITPTLSSGLPRNFVFYFDTLDHHAALGRIAIRPYIRHSLRGLIFAFFARYKFLRIRSGDASRFNFPIPNTLNDLNGWNDWNKLLSHRVAALPALGRSRQTLCISLYS